MKEGATLGEMSDPGKCLRFRDASTRARDLIMAHGDSPWVQRTDAGWKVAVRLLLAELMRYEVGQQVVLAAPYRQGGDNPLYAYEDYLSGLEAELNEEIEDDRENWARSDQEG